MTLTSIALCLVALGFLVIVVSFEVFFVMDAMEAKKERFEIVMALLARLEAAEKVIASMPGWEGPKWPEYEAWRKLMKGSNEPSNH